MRQFDVFVWGGEEFTPPFTDSALEWFLGNDFNAGLEKSEAEWIVFAHKSINIDRRFLNDLADTIAGYPMVDAFAPRINYTSARTFLSGYRLDARKGLDMLDENAAMRFVATPHPLLAVFSRRIVQRTGAFDQSLCIPVQLVDYAFRMLHAGGKMFSVPSLVACLAPETNVPASASPNEHADDLALALVKAFGYWKNRKFLLRHASTLRTLWNKRKELEKMRDKAILLSKLDKKFLDDLA